VRTYRLTLLALSILISASASTADEGALRTVKKAVERSTLNQPGTKPFHLKAEFAPSFARDNASHHTGTIEIWWQSPTQWRRELSSPTFHQIAVVNGFQEWQKNEGDYFPEWLREIYVAIINPVPDPQTVLTQAKTGEVRALFGATNLDWTIMSSDGNVQKTMGAGLSIRNDLLEYGSGLGWSFDYKDFKGFHGRSIARTVSSGSLTAKVVLLEDLHDVSPGFFDIPASGGDLLIRTEVVNELALRKNLLPQSAPAWPPVKDGPLQGILTTEVLVDQTGKVREVGTMVTDNPALDSAASEFISKMQFNPYLDHGVPVQVVSRITMPFKTVRPAGVETFDSARNYFEHGRLAGFPAAGSGPPYELKASFRVKLAATGATEEGHYVDTWKSPTEWRRELSIAKSRFVRSQRGENRYQLFEGPNAGLLGFILQVMEPIPAIDTFVESDWRMKREPIGNVGSVRVLTGYEAPDGTLDPEQARGFWFDDKGELLKVFLKGLEIRRSDFQEFSGARIARDIRVLQKGQVAIAIKVDSLAPLTPIPSDDLFTLRGHEWKRAFTAEVR
jgi:hypothetical protein